MADFSGFAKGAGNLLTGGLLGALSNETFNPQKMEVPKTAQMRREELMRAASYDPGLLKRIGNLMSGGIYGQFSGMAEKQQIASQAKDLIIQQEMERKLRDRMAQQNLNPIEEPPVM